MIYKLRVDVAPKFIIDENVFHVLLFQSLPSTNQYFTRFSSKKYKYMKNKIKLNPYSRQIDYVNKI